MEQPNPRKAHGHAVLIADLNHIVVAHRSAGLSHILHAASVRPLDIITKGEERVGSQRHAAHPIKPRPLRLGRKHLRLHLENLLPCAVSQHIHVILSDIEINGIIPVRPSDTVHKL